MTGDVQHPILAIYYDAQGHSESQIIYPESRTAFGINFHGKRPSSPANFTGIGGILVPITKQSAEAIRDELDNLRLLAESTKAPDLAYEALIGKLYEIATQHPTSARHIVPLAEQLSDVLIHADDRFGSDHVGAGLIDIISTTRQSLLRLRETLLPIDPDAANKVHNPKNHHTGRESTAWDVFCPGVTPYYHLQGAGAFRAYERHGKQPVNYLGDEPEVPVDTSRFMRPSNGIPLSATNCLHYVLCAAQHPPANVPLYLIDPRLRTSGEDDPPNKVTGVEALEQITQELLRGGKRTEDGHIAYDLRRIKPENPSAGTRILAFEADKPLTFPQDLEQLKIDGKSILNTLFADPNPLLRSTSQHHR